MKILIIDDDRAILQTLLERLSRWGYHALTAENATEALTLLSTQHVDLILLDVYLKDITAIELIPKLKGINPIAGIITMTGQSSRQLELKIRSFGILYYMEKPIETDNFKLILEHINKRINNQ